jgi:hypothetical protein
MAGNFLFGRSSDEASDDTEEAEDDDSFTNTSSENDGSSDNGSDDSGASVAPPTKRRKATYLLACCEWNPLCINNFLAHNNLLKSRWQRIGLRIYQSRYEITFQFALPSAGPQIQSRFPMILESRLTAQLFCS